MDSTDTCGFEMNAIHTRDCARIGCAMRQGKQNNKNQAAWYIANVETVACQLFWCIADAVRCGRVLGRWTPAKEKYCVSQWLMLLNFKERKDREESKEWIKKIESEEDMEVCCGKGWRGLDIII